MPRLPENGHMVAKTWLMITLLLLPLSLSHSLSLYLTDGSLLPIQELFVPRTCPRISGAPHTNNSLLLTN